MKKQLFNDKEIIKFIKDNFSYSDIGKDEDGNYGEDKLNVMWEEGVMISEKLRNKFIEIIKKNEENYFS